MVNVDTVYKTVLYILNKEQRGYLTPEEFNKIATQVQLETFEKYFEDLNQQLRIPENDSEYGNRVKNVEEKLAIFKTQSQLLYANVIGAGDWYDTQTAPPNLPTNMYKIGTVTYNNSSLSYPVEMQRVERNELTIINKSKLTRPTLEYPLYVLEEDRIYVYPTITTSSNLTSPISASYLRKPLDVKWGYTSGTLGNYIYNSTEYNASTNPSGSTNFEIHVSDQSEVVLNILIYAGVVIRDPQIIQTASQKIQQDEVNEKS